MSARLEKIVRLADQIEALRGLLSRCDLLRCEARPELKEPAHVHLFDGIETETVGARLLYELDCIVHGPIARRRDRVVEVREVGGEPALETIHIPVATLT